MTLRHRLFQVGVVLKGMDGLLELAAAILLLIFGPDGVNRLVAWVSAYELREWPHTWWADHLIRHTHAFGAGSVHFAGIYLLIQGVVKIGLVIGLLQERRWVFPVALAIMGLLIGYMSVRMVMQASFGLGFLLLLNVVITFLIWREYQDVRSHVR